VGIEEEGASGVCTKNKTRQDKNMSPWLKGLSGWLSPPSTSIKHGAGAGAGAGTGAGAGAGASAGTSEIKARAKGRGAMQQLSASIKGVERERVRDDGGVKDTRKTHQETIKDLEKSLKELETNLTCVQSEKGEIFNKLKLTGQAQVIHGIDDSRVSGIKRDLSTKMAELLESENLLKTKINLVKTALSKTRLIEQQVQKIQLQQTLHKAESANVFAALEAVGGSLEEVEKSVTETEENLDLPRFPEAPTEAVFGLGSSTTTAPLASDAARVSLGKRSIEMPDTDAMERMMASMDMSPK